MVVERKTIESNLPKKGFVRDDTGHRYFHHEYKGRRTGIYTYTSHGSHYKDYDVSLLARMKKELKLDTLRQTADLFNCPMDGDDYNEILKGKEFIPA